MLNTYSKLRDHIDKAQDKPKMELSVQFNTSFFIWNGAKLN